MKKSREILFHLLAWTALILLFLFARAENGVIKKESIIIFVYFGLINISLFYINSQLILPQYLLKKKYWQFLVVIFVIIAASGIIKYGLAYTFKETVLLRGEQKAFISFPVYYTLSLITSTFFVFLGTTYRFIADWFINEKLKNERENEKLTVELAVLKSQINPHFLLNSLNNIYSLTYQKSDKAPEAVLKLSEIVKYILYEISDTKVELAKEIRYLQNYIDLQKIRIKGDVFAELRVSGSNDQQAIVPFILIAFVENAFKHGVVTDHANPILIDIGISGGELHFKVSNKKNMLNKDEMGGIDLQNVKRRLDMLYPGRYKLNIEDLADSYTCELFIDL